jgi:hypothetical protein
MLVLAETLRVTETLKASGTLPHWHWQPDDLQQSCLSVNLFRGTFACGEPCDDALCTGHASSPAVVVATASA